MQCELKLFLEAYSYSNENTYILQDFSSVGKFIVKVYNIIYCVYMDVLCGLWHNLQTTELELLVDLGVKNSFCLDLFPFNSMVWSKWQIFGPTVMDKGKKGYIKLTLFQLSFVAWYTVMVIKVILV